MSHADVLRFTRCVAVPCQCSGVSLMFWCFVIRLKLFMKRVWAFRESVFTFHERMMSVQWGECFGVSPKYCRRFMSVFWRFVITFWPFHVSILAFYLSFDCFMSAFGVSSEDHLSFSRGWFGVSVVCFSVQSETVYWRFMRMFFWRFITMVGGFLTMYRRS